MVVFMADYKHEIDLLDSFNADIKYIKKLMLTILDEVGDIPKEFESTFRSLKKMTDKIEFYGLELNGGAFHLDNIINKVNEIVDLCTDFDKDVEKTKEGLAYLQESGRGDRLEQRIRRLEKYIK